jgi:hypothetical protein
VPRRRYIFDPPERFVAGTVGQPGERTFFLQARDGGRVVSVVLEKVQVAVLADRLNRLLDELEQRGVTVPTAVVAEFVADAEPLDEPMVEDDAEDGPDVFRVLLTAPAARAFVNRAVRVIASGRPPCPLCGQPLDPLGHICPRRNGHYVN